jgi:hypothetical protein
MGSLLVKTVQKSNQHAIALTERWTPTVRLIAQLDGIQVSCVAFSKLCRRYSVGDVIQTTVQAENDISAVACSQ